MITLGAGISGRTFGLVSSSEASWARESVGGYLRTFGRALDARWQSLWLSLWQWVTGVIHFGAGFLRVGGRLFVQSKRVLIGSQFCQRCNSIILRCSEQQ